MRLYSGTSQQFIEDTIQNQIAEKLRLSFFNYYRCYPSDSEVRSWRNSLRAIKDIFQLANLIDHGVVLEYQLPLTSKRLDCLICGKDEKKVSNAVIIELKQWEKCFEAPGEREVLTWIGNKRESLHPSVQVGQYKMYLEDTHTAFYDETNAIGLNACSYLHNYNYYSDDVIFAPKFRDYLKRYPLFTADDVEKLKLFLLQWLSHGEGTEILKRIEESKYRPSRKLMNHVSAVVKAKLQGKDIELLGVKQKDYVLLDEQLVAYDKVFVEVSKGFHDKQKEVIIIKGGPGTGKSVIALKLLADLTEKEYNVQYATGSKSFTETLRRIVGTRAAVQFKFFLSYVDANYNEIDVLICDEAHRIREKTVRRFGKPSNLKQLEELILAAKVAVFLIDEDQIVRPQEIGSVELIREYALKYNCKISEYELEAQFRCNGSNAFINWINNTLGIRKTANVMWDQHEGFDFRIFDSPYVLEKAIRSKVEQGFTGRLTAGFCWSWSDPKSDGTLVNDVVIEDYKRPWDAKHNARMLAPGIPRAHYWAYDDNGINQIGCIYTAQGFEFDYIGVIFGKDLSYNFDRQAWEGHKENFADPEVRRSREEHFLKFIKNVYRVLLTRGIKGCYVYFMDKDTERFFKSRIEPIIESTEEYIDKMLSEVEERVKFKEYLPVYSLAAACGKFGEGTDVSKEGWIKVDIGRRLNKNMFVSKVAGHSMEPKIPNSSYCVFSKYTGGSRDGLIVLAQHHSIFDPETGGSYTVKKYTSKKKYQADETWGHEEIVLKPLSKAYEPIVISAEQAADFKVIAEFVSVI